MDELGNRVVPFGKTVYIERADFFDVEGPEGQKNGGAPPKGFKRLLPNGKVRLKFAYVIQCDEVVRDPDTQEPIELKCTVFPETRAGVTPEGTKRVKGIIHWVEATTAVTATINQYDRLFKTEEPGKESEDFLLDINADSLQVLRGAKVEPRVAMDAAERMATIDAAKDIDGETSYPSELAYQFERSGYFALDKESTADSLVLNRVVTLRDVWATTTKKKKKPKQQQKKQKGGKKKSPTQPMVEDLRRVALRAVTILEAGPHPDADSLLVCKVDCGDVDEETNEPTEPRTVVAGLAGKIPVEELVGSKVVAVTNLKPAKMRGIESFAMLLAAASEDDSIVELLRVPTDVPNGELIAFDGKEPSEPDALLKSKGALKVWDRVKARFEADDAGEATYIAEDGTVHRMITSGGPVETSSLKSVPIR